MALLAYLKSLFILQLLMGFVFVVSGLIINFIQLCTCVLWPINKQLYRRINCRLSYSLWSREYMLLFFPFSTRKCRDVPEERRQLVEEVVYRDFCLSIQPQQAAPLGAAAYTDIKYAD